MNYRTLALGIGAATVILLGRYLPVQPAWLVVPMGVSGWILGTCIGKAARYDAE